jgi:hypothetical protein
MLNTSVYAFSLDAHREMLAVCIIFCFRKPSVLPRGNVGMIVLISKSETEMKYRTTQRNLPTEVSHWNSGLLVPKTKSV